MESVISQIPVIWGMDMGQSKEPLTTVPLSPSPSRDLTAKQGLLLGPQCSPLLQTSPCWGVWGLGGRGVGLSLQCGRQGLENRKFETSVGYIAGSRPTCAVEQGPRIPLLSDLFFLSLQHLRVAVGRHSPFFGTWPVSQSCACVTSWL